MAGRPLKFADLTLYTMAMSLVVRWPAATAGAGPVSALLWLLAMAGFLLPLVTVTAEMAARFPGSGGVYDWAREAFGPFAGFLCGWCYWACNLPFFSGLLVFIVAAIGSTVGGPTQAVLATTPGYLAAGLAIAAAVTGLHLRGIGVGKWLSSLGAVGACALMLAMILGGAAVALTRGPATDFVHARYALPLNADGALLWSVILLAYGGPEAAAFLKDDVEGGLRTVLKALAAVGVTAMAAYVLATLGLLAVLPAERISHLGGLPDALRAGAAALGAPWMAPVLVGAVAVTMLGNYAAWFGLAARLPFAAGVDEALPRAFAWRDPKTGAPVAALLVQAVVVVALVLLGAAGSNMKAAYDFLVSMTVVTYVLPFLFMFAAHLKLGAPPAGAAWRIPGGPVARTAVGVTGFLFALSGALTSMAPSPDAPDKLAAVIKIGVASLLLVLAGAAIYALSRRAHGVQLEPAA